MLLLLIHCEGFNILPPFSTLTASLNCDCLQQVPCPEAKITGGTSWKRVIGRSEHYVN